ncbi:MAG: hypothetical protein QHI48_01825 [Bacteroidota bacterium]|nr:hypothetical protein [Bacteroidota bacterium]
MPLEPGLWDLSISEGALAWHGVPLERIAERFGTPVFAVSADRLRSDAGRWVESAVRAGFPCRMFFSFKTCPVPALAPIIGAFGFGMEVSACHELEAVLAAGIPPARIIVGGTGWSIEEYTLALREGVALIMIDTREDAKKLVEAAARQPMGGNVGLRFALGVKPRGTARLTASSVRSNRFGLEPGGEECREILSLLRSRSSLRLTTVHSHIGTGLTDLSAFRRNFTVLAGVYKQLVSMGFPLESMDVGGGLGVPTVRVFSSFEFLVYAGGLRRPPPPRAVGRDLVSAYFSVLQRAWREEFGAGRRPPEILLEPGRAVVSASVLLLLRVLHVRMRSGRRIAVADGGALSTGLSVLAEYHEVFRVHAPREKVRYLYDIVGRIPTPLDILYRKKWMPELREGDLIAVMDAGAYMIPTITGFASLRPPIVLIEDGELRCIVSRERGNGSQSGGAYDV